MTNIKLKRAGAYPEGGTWVNVPPVRISKNFNQPSEIMPFDGKPWEIIKQAIFYF